MGGDAKLDRLVMRVVPDATTRALELLNGSLDLSPAFSSNLGPGTAEVVQYGLPQLTFVNRSGGTSAGLWINPTTVLDPPS